jgi:hypothetical protein
MQLRMPDAKEKDDDDGWDYLTASIRECMHYYYDDDDDDALMR